MAKCYKLQSPHDWRLHPPVSTWQEVTYSHPDDCRLKGEYILELSLVCRLRSPHSWGLTISLPDEMKLHPSHG
jgi:hypothetical protein